MDYLRDKINIITLFLHKRVLWADIAKALAIICVIWGHAGSGNQVILYRNVLYAFHIPTFLLVSGYLMRFPSGDNQNIKAYLKFLFKNILYLIVPYIFWGIFFSNFSVKNVLPILYGSYQTIKTVNVIGAIWFVPCFFFARVFTYTLMVIFNRLKYKKIYLSLSVVVMFAIGFVLPLLDKGYFWSFNIAFVLAGFLLLGIATKEILDSLNSAKWYVIVSVLVVCIVAFYFGTLFRGENFELVCMYNGNYGNKFWFIYNALFGSGAIISLSMLIAKKDCTFVRRIQYIGTQTLGILFFHVPFMRQVMMPWFTNIGFINPDWFVALIAALCTLIVCLILNTLISFICPVLVGRKQYEIAASKTTNETE